MEAQLAVLVVLTKIAWQFFTFGAGRVMAYVVYIR